MQQGKKIVQPSFLKPKDKVAFISPAYWIVPAAIHMAAEVVKVEPVNGKHVNSQESSAYVGNADERAAD